MKFAIIILFDILLLIKNTNELPNELDRRCEKGKRCVSQDDCPDFLKKKEFYHIFKRSGGQEGGLAELLRRLQERICNKRAKAVCCKIEAEEKCEDGKSCIPLDQCRYAEDIRAKYENGDNAAKYELIGLICNEKEKKVCCSKDQETGIETTTTLSTSTTTTSNIKTSTTTLTTSITTLTTNSTSSSIKTTTTHVVASTTTTASIKTSTTSTIIKTITTTSSIKTPKPSIKTWFNCSPNLCMTKDQCTIIKDLFRKLESTEDIFLLKAAKDKLESRKCSPEIDTTYGSETYCCDPCPWDIMSNSCHDCACNMVGSVNTICTEGGTCSCKAGVTGQKCDQCEVQVRDVRTEDVMLLQTTVSVEESDLCPPGTNISVDVKPKPKQKYFLTAETPTETFSFVRHFTFTRLQEYVITVTVCDKVCKNNIKYHDTMEYKCGDVFDESIPHSKLCDSKNDCENGEDEAPETCQGHTSLGGLYFLIGFTCSVILTYVLIIKKRGACIQKESGKKAESRNTCDFMKILAEDGDKSTVQAIYEERHQEGFRNHEAYIIEFFFRFSKDFDRKQLITKWIQEKECLIHQHSSEEIYKCSKLMFGDLSTPEIISKVNILNFTKVYKILSVILRKLQPIMFALVALKMFIFLELNLYDFVKDTEIALAIHHYDRKIAQYLNNDQNYGFNINYLFWSILTAIIIGQVMVPIYWFLNNDRPRFFKTDQDSSRMMKVLLTVIPYIPGILPILVFCEIISAKRKIEFQQKKLPSCKSFKCSQLDSEFTKDDLESFIQCCEDKVKLENLRSDIKCIEIISETYLQMIFQAIMLLRLRIVIKKNQIFGFQFDFVTFVLITMVFSCITMMLGVRAYHIRNKKHLRPMFSMGNVILTFSWIILITTKIILNAVCFINYPGLVAVPVIVQIIITYSLQTLPAHLQIVHTLMVSFIPLSLTDLTDDVKSCKHLPLVVSFLLFIIECFCVIFFSFMMNMFYHFEEYRKYQAVFTKNIIKLIPLPVEGFNGVLLSLIVLVTISTIVSGTLQTIYYAILHPKVKIFTGIIQEDEKAAENEVDLPIVTFKKDEEIVSPHNNSTAIL